MEDETVQLNAVIIVVFLRYKSVHLSHSTILRGNVCGLQLPAEFRCPAFLFCECMLSILLCIAIFLRIHYVT